ncbi:MAG: tetratricopeptide repeat protein [Bacteroidota bacterium]
MATLQAKRQIIDVVKRHCGSRNVSGLVRELQKIGQIDPKTFGSTRGRHRFAKQVGAVTESEFLDHVITLCQTALPGEEVSPVLLEIGDIFKKTGEMQRAAEMYSLVLSIDERSTGALGKSVNRAEALMRRGEVRSCLGRWKESQGDLVRSRSLFAALKEKVAVGRVDNILGTNYAEQGDLTLAWRFFQRAYAVFEESDQKELTGTVLMNLGIILNIRGLYDEALGQYRRAQSCFEQLGDMRRLAQLHHNIGMTHLQREQTNEAIKEFNLSYFLGSKQNLVPIMASAEFGKASAFYKRQDPALALKLVAQAIGQFEKCGDRLGQADGYKLKGMIHRDLKQYALAASYFRTSLRLDQELDNKLNAAETRFEMGIMERRRRKRQAALQAFTEALDLFRKVGAAGEIKKAETEIRTLTGRIHAS